jgi:hypothetical protein
MIGRQDGRSLAMGSRQLAAGLVILALSVSGCSTFERNAREGDFCTQYKQMVTQAQKFKDQNLNGSKAADLQTQVQQFQTQLNRLTATSDGRLNTGYSDLQSALQDFQASAASRREAAKQNAQALKDSFDEVQSSWAELQQSIKAQCP